MINFSMPYNGCLTAEQFLFHEMRIVAKQYLDGKPIDEIIEYIKRDNLFQYPTERKVSKLARACHRRIVALGNEKLVYEAANAPVDVAKQINLYAMMRYNRLVREFMTDLMRTDYVHEQQERYHTQLSHITGSLNTATGTERARFLKQQDKLTEQAREIGSYEEKVHHLADQNIEIDLDDGIKKNYAIFADVLAKI